MKSIGLFKLKWSTMFKPAIVLMNKLRYPQKFLLIGIVFIIPIILLTGQLLTSIMKDSQAVKLELKGMTIQQQLGELMVSLDQYGRSLHSLEGVQAPQGADIKQIQDQIDRILASIKDEGARSTPKLMDEQVFTKLQEQWKSISSSGKDLSQAYYELQHEQLEQLVVKLIEEVEEISKLSLDPEADSSYFINFTVHLFPQFWNKLEQIELKGIEVAARHQIKNPQEQEELIQLSGEVESLLEQVTNSTELFKKQNPALEAKIHAQIENNQLAAAAAVNALNEKIINAGVIRVTANEFAIIARNAKSAALELYRSQMSLLFDQLEHREKAYAENLVLDALVILVILLLVVYLFIAFYLAVKKGIDQLGHVSHLLVQGDLTVRVKADTKDEFNQVVGAFNNLADSFTEVIRKSRLVVERAIESSQQLQTSVKETTDGSVVIQNIMGEVAHGSQILVKSSEETSTAMMEVSAGVQRIAETSSIVAEAANDAAAEARQGFQDMNQAVEQMTAIKSKVSETAFTISEMVDLSKKIGHILEVITDISEQTRLLALNASIEAARAGEHGRGFQVVATEVRKLADQSGESAKQIAQLIAKVQASSREVVRKVEIEINEVEKGSHFIAKVGLVFESILNSVDQVAVQIQEVSSASEQISASTQQVTASMDDSVHISRKATAHTEDVSTSLQKQATSTKEVEVSSKMLNHLSEELLQSLAQFRLN